MPRTSHTLDNQDDQRREVAELKQDITRLQHQVDRLEQLERLAQPRTPPRLPGGGSDGNWMGW